MIQIPQFEVPRAAAQPGICRGVYERVRKSYRVAKYKTLAMGIKISQHQQDQVLCVQLSTRRNQ